MGRKTVHTNKLHRCYIGIIHNGKKVGNAWIRQHDVVFHMNAGNEELGEQLANDPRQLLSLHTSMESDKKYAAVMITSVENNKSDKRFKALVLRMLKLILRAIIPYGSMYSSLYEELSHEATELARELENDEQRG